MENTPDLVAVKSILGIDMADIVAVRDRAAEQVAVLAAALGVAESATAKTLPTPFLPYDANRVRPYDNDPVLSQMDDMVRDMAIMQSLQQNLSSLCNEEEFFLALKESARILFGMSRLAFLSVNRDKSILSGAKFAGQSVLLQQLEISLNPANSLIAAVASGEQPYSTFDEIRPAEISLVDIQIAHMLDSEGLLYVPMCAHGQHIGVMVYGISAVQHSRIQKRLVWMTNFANLAAISIEAWLEMGDKERNLEANVAKRYESLARRVAHEAGNPLSIIKNYLKIVTQKISDDDGVRQELDILSEEIDRVSTILQRLNSLNEACQETSAININSIIEGMLSLYSDSLFTSRNITVTKSLSPSLPLISSDRDSIKQILLNIWKNSSEALSAGERVDITTADNISKHGRDFIEIRLSDTGPGLPPEVVQRLFQPLEPDRRPGHSGLGLSIVATLVQSLNGLITCQSAEGQGTTFSILLPRPKGNNH
jgi:nitrogen-specific signal transduction histidine kinase